MSYQNSQPFHMARRRSSSRVSTASEVVSRLTDASTLVQQPHSPHSKGRVSPSDQSRKDRSAILAPQQAHFNMFVMSAPMRPGETNGAPAPKDAAPPGGARKGPFCSPDSLYASRARQWKP